MLQYHESAEKMQIVILCPRNSRHGTACGAQLPGRRHAGRPGEPPRLLYTETQGGGIPSDGHQVMPMSRNRKTDSPVRAAALLVSLPEKPAWMKRFHLLCVLPFSLLTL